MATWLKTEFVQNAKNLANHAEESLTNAQVALKKISTKERKKNHTSLIQLTTNA